MPKLYSNEIVFRGHPDKVCDQISAAILDAALIQDHRVRAGIECLIKNNLLVIAGEITTTANLDYASIARRVLKDIGYNGDKYKIVTELSIQSPNIALGVDKFGAGDNGMMFGYACDDTPELLPLAMVILQKFARAYDKLAHTMPTVFFPDGKAQITGVYDDDFRLVRIKDFTICYCNAETNRTITDNMIKKLATDICDRYDIEIERFLINPTGAFNIGGSYADAGLTGRKIVVDAYQSFANVGGGCQNGKDPSKVDISGAHKAREIAKAYLMANKLHWCEVQLSFAIGLERPLAVYINSDIGVFEPSEELFNRCKPATIIKDLELLNVQYEELAKFGHYTK